MPLLLSGHEVSQDPLPRVSSRLAAQLSPSKEARILLCKCEALPSLFKMRVTGVTCFTKALQEQPLHVESGRF